jgi:cyclohexadienyl dehydratase
MMGARLIFTAAFAALAIFAQTSAASAQNRLQQIFERGTLRVGTTGDFNPMSVRDPATNSYKGYDIEAMTQLAKDMGVQVEWVATDWSSFMAGITSNRFDIFAGGASLNMARAKVAGFTIPYMEAGTVPVATKATAAKFKSWEDVNKPGVTVAVTLGTVFEEQAKRMFPNAKINSVQPPAAGYQEVMAGRADVTITSNVEASQLTQRYSQLGMVDTPPRNRRPFAYVVKQDEFAFINYLNNWVTLKTYEGFFEGLQAKWLPKS